MSSNSYITPAPFKNASGPQHHKFLLISWAATAVDDWVREPVAHALASSKHMWEIGNNGHTIQY